MPTWDLSMVDPKLAGGGPKVTIPIAHTESPTFGVFVTSHGEVSFDSAVIRVFVRFTDAGGVGGSTSGAVKTP